MTVYGAIFAAISRKVAAFVAECRALVAEAEAIEQKLVATAKAEVKAILTKTKNDQQALRNDLVDKISKI